MCAWAQVIFVEGGLNFLSLYQGVITIRILLSWFPQAQGVGLLRPLFTVSDAYLNLFRGIVPPIGGIDISPIGAVRTAKEAAPCGPVAWLTSDARVLPLCAVLRAQPADAGRRVAGVHWRARTGAKIAPHAPEPGPASVAA